MKDNRENRLVVLKDILKQFTNSRHSHAGLCGCAIHISVKHSKVFSKIWAEEVNERLTTKVPYYKANGTTTSVGTYWGWQPFAIRERRAWLQEKINTLENGK